MTDAAGAEAIRPTSAYLGIGGVPRSPRLEGLTNEMVAAWENHAARLKSKLEQLKHPHPDWTEDELIVYLREYRRLAETTIRKRITQLRHMGRHGPMPVRLHGSRYELVSTFFLHVRYREDVEEVGPGGLVNDHKAIRALGDFLAIPRDVWPTAPAQVKHNDRDLPSPEDVYDLLHEDYVPNAKRAYNNALLKGLLLLDFGFGVRFPSEAHALKLDHVDLERHLIVVTEPKKSGRRRRLLIEPTWLCCSTRHPSLGNYLRWRDKVDPEREQEAFFLKEDGTPFPNKEALRRFLDRHVRPKFPWFHPYLGRHWNANARLIDSDSDYIAVSDWLGHESVDMLRREYEHDSRLYKRLYGGDWLRRIARRGKV